MAYAPPPSPPAYCITQAAARYSIPEDLIRAELKVEGGGRNVVAHNKNGSSDLGWMQVNTLWLPMLAQYGISRHGLLTDPCTNISVGTWILQGYYLQFRDWTKAIRAYNVGPDLQGGPDDGYSYATKVITAWNGYHDQRRVALSATPVAFTPQEESP